MVVRRFVSVAALSAPLALFACSSESPVGPSGSGPTKASGASEAAADSGAVSDSGVGTGAGDGGGAHRDAGQAHDGGVPCDGGKCTVGAACTADSECETNVCFKGGQGSACTKRCEQATAAKDCPSPPYLGICNKQLYCKLF